MKTHRIILCITLCLFLICVLFIIIFTQERIFNISLAIMGSSFVSFIVELPNYYNAKNITKNNLYCSIFVLKSNTSMIINSTNKILENNEIINDKLFGQFLPEINNNIYLLRSIDQDYFVSKNKKKKMSDGIQNIFSSYLNLDMTIKKYNVEYYRFKLKTYEKDKLGRNLKAEDLQNHLNLVNEMCLSLIETINTNSQFFLNKKQKKQWILDNEIIINNEKKFKASQL